MIFLLLSQATGIKKELLIEQNHENRTKYAGY